MMAPQTSRQPICFIAGGPKHDINQLRSAIAERGYIPISREDIPLTVPTRISSTIEAVRRARLIVGLGDVQFDPNALFVVGVAVGIGKPVVVFTTEDDTRLRDTFGSVVEIVNASLTNSLAVGFALDQALVAAKKSQRAIGSSGGGAWSSGPRMSATSIGPIRDGSKSAGLGAGTDKLLNDSRSVESVADLASVVRRALEQLGLMYAEQPTAEMERGADFAVWEERLEPVVRNPILIELKVSRTLLVAGPRAALQRFREYARA
jgi:hypothetical protein